MYTKIATLKLFGVTLLVFLQTSLGLASTNFWDTLASNLGINPNDPNLTPEAYEEKLCSQLNIVCYPCSHYSNNPAECDRRLECGFHCGERKCKDINDPSLSNSNPDFVCHTCEQYTKNHDECNRRPRCAYDCGYNKCKNLKDPSLDLRGLNCPSQCKNPCGCQVQSNCFYSDIGTSVYTGLSSNEPICAPVEFAHELNERYFEDFECYRGIREPYEYYFSNGKLSPLVNQEDKGACAVEEITAEYIREFDGVFDHDRSHPCTTLSLNISDHFWETSYPRETFGLFELVVVFDKLDDWLPLGEHRVFSVSLFAFRWSVTLKRDDFPAAEKIKIYWSFIVGSKGVLDVRSLSVKGFNQASTHVLLDPFEIKVCDQPVNSCFRGKGIVRPASITVNKFKRRGSSETPYERLCSVRRPFLDSDPS